MVTRKEIARIISGYENPRIGVLGSHSALEIMDGANEGKPWCFVIRARAYKNSE